MNTELIQLKGVTKRFKKNIVLDDIDLNIPEKQITGIIGASGMGKTTILKMIIGFYKPNSGRITYLKRDVLKDLKNIRQIFGFSTEDGSFYEDLTVKENLYHFGSLYKMQGEDIKRRTREILEFVNLSKALNTKARDLSVGMKKRLDFACSLVHDPEVLILDEPTADLDPLLRDQILSLIQKIKKTGTTVVMTTQLLEEMDKVADYIAVLHNKKIIEKDSPKKIREKYSSDDLNEVFGKIFSKKEEDFKESDKNDKKNVKIKEEKPKEKRENLKEKKGSEKSGLDKILGKSISDKKNNLDSVEKEEIKQKTSSKKKEKSKKTGKAEIDSSSLKKEDIKQKTSSKKKEKSEDLIGKFLLRNKKNTKDKKNLNEDKNPKKENKDNSEIKKSLKKERFK